MTRIALSLTIALCAAPAAAQTVPLTERLDAALAECTEEIRVKPSPAAYERCGFIQINRKDYERAIADFTAALDAEPDRPFALYARGMARLFSGDAAGQNEMESALLRRPQVAEEFKRYGGR